MTKYVFLTTHFTACHDNRHEMRHPRGHRLMQGPGPCLARACPGQEGQPKRPWGVMQQVPGCQAARRQEVLDARETKAASREPARLNHKV